MSADGKLNAWPETAPTATPASSTTTAPDQTPSAPHVPRKEAMGEYDHTNKTLKKKQEDSLHFRRHNPRTTDEKAWVEELLGLGTTKDAATQTTAQDLTPPSHSSTTLSSLKDAATQTTVPSHSSTYDDDDDDEEEQDPFKNIATLVSLLSSLDKVKEEGDGCVNVDHIAGPILDELEAAIERLKAGEVEGWGI